MLFWLCGTKDLSRRIDAVDVRVLPIFFSAILKNTHIYDNPREAKSKGSENSEYVLRREIPFSRREF